MTTTLPDGLHLFLAEDGTLQLTDAQLLPHVTFTFGCGDPCDWSALIVRRTCQALEVTGGFVEVEDTDGAGIDYIIDLWHTFHEAHDGFLP